MHIFTISKGNGKSRLIYAPNSEEKREFSRLLGVVISRCRALCRPEIVHGFMPGKSAVTNAMPHVGHKFTLNFDLADFFDSVRPCMVEGKLPAEIIEQVFVDGAPRQGLPSSPAVANLAATSLDTAIVKWRKKTGAQFVYTRYADDLTFSFDDQNLTADLQAVVKATVSRCGFRLAEHKTKLQSASGGRRMVTGVAVGDYNIVVPRAIRRRMRAAAHQGRAPQLAGLSEWAKLKLPCRNTRIRVGESSSDEIGVLLKAWKLSGMVREVKIKPTDDLGGDCFVIGDPIYMLGMSTFTNGWTSCMAFPRGQFRKGVVTWALQQHTRIAAELSPKTVVAGGCERREMRSRALVHELQNGVKVYGRLFPHADGKPLPVCDKLVAALQSAGYVPISSMVGKKIPIKGRTPWVCGGPYIDHGTFSLPVKSFTDKKRRFAKLIT